MATSSMFISPKYNVGERCAGGTLTIYADNSLQALVQLWCYADLKSNPEDGTGRIANPVPIDNNGISSSAVFYDSGAYPAAYYVLRDAQNAVVRSGFVVPQSWQMTGEPGDPANPWDNALRGDLFWGYEVAASVAGRGNIGRPLFFMPGSNADKSGGMVVWFQPGAIGVDNVLTFQGNGGIWKAREEWINYSYLENALGNVFGAGAHEPFRYVQANYGGQYNINLDKCPNPPTSQPFNTEFTGRIRISGSFTGQASSNSFGITVTVPSPDMLEITESVPFNYIGAGSNPVISFVMRGGNFPYTSILQNVNGSISNYVTGYLDSVFMDNMRQAGMINLAIGALAGPGNVDFGLIAMTNSSVHSTASSSLVASQAASSLKNAGIIEFIADANYNLGIDSDINFNLAGKDAMITLYATGTTNNPAYYVKPSKCWNVGNVLWHAKNAEFYNQCSFAPSIGITASLGQEANSSNVNLINLKQTAGALNLANSAPARFFCQSPLLDISGYSQIYVSAFASANNALLIFDMNVNALMTGATGPKANSAFVWKVHCDARIQKSSVHLRSLYTPWNWNMHIIALFGMAIENSSIYLGAAMPVLSGGSSIKNSNVYSLDTGVIPQSFDSRHILMDNDSEISNCVFHAGANAGFNCRGAGKCPSNPPSLYTSPSWPDYATRPFDSSDPNPSLLMGTAVEWKNIKFNGNRSFVPGASSIKMMSAGPVDPATNLLPLFSFADNMMPSATTNAVEIKAKALRFTNVEMKGNSNFVVFPLETSIIAAGAYNSSYANSIYLTQNGPTISGQPAASWNGAIGGEFFSYREFNPFQGAIDFRNNTFSCYNPNAGYCTQAVMPDSTKDALPGTSSYGSWKDGRGARESQPRLCLLAYSEVPKYFANTIYNNVAGGLLARNGWSNYSLIGLTDSSALNSWIARAISAAISRMDRCPLGGRIDRAWYNPIPVPGVPAISSNGLNTSGGVSFPYGPEPIGRGVGTMDSGTLGTIQTFANMSQPDGIYPNRHLNRSDAARYVGDGWTLFTVLYSTTSGAISSACIAESYVADDGSGILSALYSFYCGGMANNWVEINQNDICGNFGSTTVGGGNNSILGGNNSIPYLIKA